MAISDSFLATCRAQILSLTELTTFQTALTKFESANGTDAQRAAWHECFSDAQANKSPAHQLRLAIRAVIGNQNLTDLSSLERESAYRTLESQFVTARYEPPTVQEERQFLQDLLIEQMAE